MKVLAVVPDLTILNILRRVASYNPGIDWHVIVVRSDAADEPVEWASACERMMIADRILIPMPPEPPPAGVDDELFAYEVACTQMCFSVIKWYFEYDWGALRSAAHRLENLVDAGLGAADCLVLWGERCWYNVVAKRTAQHLGWPVLHLERASFPGMFVADPSGLDQETNTLSAHYLANEMDSAKEVELGAWLPLASLQTIEPQAEGFMGDLLGKINSQLPSVLVPLQVPFDTNMVFRAPGVHRNMALVERVMEMYPSGDTVLAKFHPADRFSDRDKLFWECRRRGVYLIEHGLYDLLGIAEHVVSINSQVVVDAAIRGVPFTTLGDPGFIPNVPDLDIRRWLHTLRFRYYVGPHQIGSRITEATERGQP